MTTCFCLKCKTEHPWTGEHFVTVRGEPTKMCRECSRAYARNRGYSAKFPPPDGLKRAAYRYSTARRGTQEEVDARQALIDAVLAEAQQRGAA